MRRGHAIDEGVLKRYLDRHAAADLPGYHLEWQLTVRQFNAGQSNPTYLLTFGNIDDESPELRVVLRKRPPRVNVASAHNVRLPGSSISFVTNLPTTILNSTSLQLYRQS